MSLKSVHFGKNRQFSDKYTANGGRLSLENWLKSVHFGYFLRSARVFTEICSFCSFFMQDALKNSQVPLKSIIGIM